MEKKDKDGEWLPSIVFVIIVIIIIIIFTIATGGQLPEAIDNLYY